MKTDSSFQGGATFSEAGPGLPQERGLVGPDLYKMATSIPPQRSSGCQDVATICETDGYFYSATQCMVSNKKPGDFCLKSDPNTHAVCLVLSSWLFSPPLI